MEPAEILDEIASAKRALPLVPGMVDEATPRDLAASLQSRELLRDLAELFRVEADAYKRVGDTRRAVFCLRRSLGLFEELDPGAADSSLAKRTAADDE